MSFGLHDWPPPPRSASLRVPRVPGLWVGCRSTRAYMQLRKNGVATLLAPSMVPTGTPFSYVCSFATPGALALQTVFNRGITLPEESGGKREDVTASRGVFARDVDVIGETHLRRHVRPTRLPAARPPIQEIPTPRNPAYCPKHQDQRPAAIPRVSHALPYVMFTKVAPNASPLKQGNPKKHQSRHNQTIKGKKETASPLNPAPPS